MTSTDPVHSVSESVGYVTVCVEVTSLTCSEVDIWLTLETQDDTAMSKCDNNLNFTTKIFTHNKVFHQVCPLFLLR